MNITTDNEYSERGRFTMRAPDLNTQVDVFQLADGSSQIHVEAGAPMVTTEILNRALGAFWRSVAESYPATKTGDLDPGDAFDILARSTVNRWLELNHPAPVLVFINGEAVRVR